MAKQKLDPNQCVITLEERLSVEELEKCSSRLAKLVGDLDNTKAEKSQAMKEFNDEIDSIQKSMSIVAEEVKTAIRKTEVMVTKKENRKDGIIEFVNENGVIVHTTPLLIEAGTQLHIEDVVDVTVEHEPIPEEFGFDKTTGWLNDEDQNKYFDAIIAFNRQFEDEHNPPQASLYGFDELTSSWESPDKEMAYQLACKRWNETFYNVETSLAEEDFAEYPEDNN